MLKECYQKGLPESSLRSFFIGYISSCLFQKTYWATFLPQLPQPCNQGTLLGQMNNAKNNKTQLKCWFVGFLKGDTNLEKGKEASQLHSGSNCKHSLNFTCHTHKRNATEGDWYLNLFAYLHNVFGAMKSLLVKLARQVGTIQVGQTRVSQTMFESEWKWSQQGAHFIYALPTCVSVQGCVDMYLRCFWGQFGFDPAC